jgi:N-methylhydantoinase B/oxoprolinase/acetone carboxylase alpha subunit
VRVQTNAGGGFGDPFERDPELVLGDVLDRYVSIDGAKQNYGVIIDAKTLTLDVAATHALRASRDNVKQ